MTELALDHGGLHRRQTTGSSRATDAVLSAAWTITLACSIHATTLSWLAPACRVRREKLVDQAMRRSIWFE